MAVPASTLAAYSGVGASARPPAPVTEALHGSIGLPSKVNRPAGQVTSVVDGGRAMDSEPEPDDAARVAVPAKLAPTPVAYAPAPFDPRLTPGSVATPDASVTADPTPAPRSVNRRSRR